MDQEFYEILKLFRYQVEKIKSNKDFFTNLHWNLNFSQSKGIKSEFKRPDDKSIKAIVMDFRPFLLEDEPINFYKICNLIYCNISNLKLKDKVKEIRKAWSILLERKKGNTGSGLRLKFGPKDILSEENLNTWLNGEYFHLDKDKRKILEQMNLMPPFRDLSLFQFIDLLQSLSLLIFHLDKEVVEKIIKT